MVFSNKSFLSNDAFKSFKKTCLGSVGHEILAPKCGTDAINLYKNYGLQEFTLI